LQRRETKVEPSFFTVWKRTRTLDEPDPDRKGSMWVSDGSELRYTEYCKKLGEMHGTDVDPLSVPFDPEVAVLAGQGRGMVAYGLVTVASIQRPFHLSASSVVAGRAPILK
jgi:hypothetical protein